MRLAPTVPVLASLLLMLGWAGMAAAQQATPAPEPEVSVAEPEVDPPGRVARLSFIKGDVSFQAADGEGPEDAVLNHPVTSGDRLMTGPDSRAELTMGIAAIRADENTDLSVAVLDDEIAQIEVNSGTVSVRVREIPSGNTIEVDTPGSAIRLLQPGEYRVDVATDGTATLAVREGDAEIDAGSGPVRVGARQKARLASGARFADVRAIDRMDEFDEWSARRERELTGTVATRYVSREVVGYEDLDRYGTWDYEPEYGTVWYPRHVVVGWAPYRYGSWKWIGPWGWTWIDHSPWGFAPFHYGRWAFVGHRWCWVPGPRFRRPFYAPGLVVWTGWHHHHGGFHFSRHHRPKGWYPLGPRDVYIPHRRVSPRYLRAVNVSNTLIENNTLLTNAYRNRVRDLRFANRDIPGAHTTGPDRDPPRLSRFRTDRAGSSLAAHRNRTDDGRLTEWRRDNDRRNDRSGDVDQRRSRDDSSRAGRDDMRQRSFSSGNSERLTQWRREEDRNARGRNWNNNRNDDGRLTEWRREQDRSSSGRNWNNNRSNSDRLTEWRREQDRSSSGRNWNNNRSNNDRRSWNNEARSSSGSNSGSNSGRLTEWRGREQRSNSGGGSLMRGSSGSQRQSYSGGSSGSQRQSYSGGSRQSSAGASARSSDRGARGNHQRR